MLERRRPLLEPALLRRVSLAWALVAALFTLVSLGSILGHRFPDGDDIMRLVQLRDWLGGQGWYDLTQYRTDPPRGVAMHWSRLVDLPLAAVIVSLSPLIGSAAAEQAALIAVPLLTLFFVLLLIGRMAWRLFGEEATGLACLVAAVAVPLVHQLRPMRIDHHGWQIVCALIAVNALMARDARRGGWMAGTAMAVWLAISMEGVPMVAALLGIGLWRWLRGPRQSEWLVAMLQALAAGSLVLFLVLRGLPFAASFCDAMSPAHLAALGSAAIGTTALGRAAGRPLPFILLVLGTVALASLTVLLTIAPQCAAGAFGGLDPLAKSFWLANVGEGLPIWRQSLATALQIAVPPVIAIAVSLRLARQSSGWLRRWHSEYAVLLIAALATACLVARGGALASALAAVPLGWQLRQWLRAARHDRPGKQALAATAIVAALLPAFPLTLLMAAAPGHAAPVAQIAAADCNIGKALAGIGGSADVLAPIDSGPGILLATPHRVVATPHHRADLAIGDTIRAFTGSGEEARAMVERRGIEYVALCPQLGEVRIYRATAPQGFAAQLSQGRQYGWLEPMSREGAVLLYRVRR